MSRTAIADRQWPIAAQVSQPYRCGYDGNGEQARDELHQVTSGEGFRTQHHHRQAAGIGRKSSPSV
jgi:hypothetical protein